MNTNINFKIKVKIPITNPVIVIQSKKLDNLFCCFKNSFISFTLNHSQKF
jgi:hypothetical protein